MWCQKKKETPFLCVHLDDTFAKFYLILLCLTLFLCLNKRVSTIRMVAPIQKSSKYDMQTRVSVFCVCIVI